MENLNFVAIDLETATQYRSSICEIGISIVKDSQVVDTLDWLIKPPGNKYDNINISIHGITPEMTEFMPEFSEVWKEVLPYLDNSVVVAHNSSFDMYALRDAFYRDNIEFPSFLHFCSYRIAKYIYSDAYSYSLPNICRELDIPFGKHHRAGGDAKGCAELFIKLMELADVKSLGHLQEMFEFNCGEFASNDYFRPQLACRGSIGAEIERDTSHRIKFQHHFTLEELEKIKEEESTTDEGGCFFGKTVCFTGKFNLGTREELLRRIARLGGIPVDSVTKKTNILVVGQQDYRIVGEDGLSGKQEKAIKLKDSGSDIEIISELEFLRMI